MAEEVDILARHHAASGDLAPQAEIIVDQPSSKREGRRGTTMSRLDYNGDGRVDKDEMKRALHKVKIRADYLFTRMTVEKDLKAMVSKLPLFLVCLGSFLTGLMAFAPPESTADVHTHIKDHFHSQSIKAIKDFNGIYDYMDKFSRANAELQATSSNYWCESRYWEYVWDRKLMVPRRTCASPRQRALALVQDPSWSWASVNASGREPTSFTGESTSCKDNDLGLQEALSDSSKTCSGFPEACELEVGLVYCQKTCRYCPPWRYERFRKLPTSQFTILPVVVYQSRFVEGACSGFAEIYQKQPHNPNLLLLPALDGPRNGPLLSCVDRSQQLDHPFALELECPEDAPKTECAPGGRYHVTSNRMFAGETVYPKVLSEPRRHIDQLRALEWLDAQTDVVTLGTMVYTEGVELFTLVRVHFSISKAGTVRQQFSMVSYSDLINGRNTWFVACMAFTSLCALLGVLKSVHGIYRHWSICRLGREIYELVSRGLLLVYPVYLLISWSQMVSMSTMYDDLLQTFIKGSNKSDSEKTLDKLFELKEHILAENSWMSQQILTANVLLYFQFLQLIMYMSVHPKLGLLTDTLTKSWNHLFHFFVLSGTLFLMLGFMAHWMLGGHMSQFATFRVTMRSQIRMLFGEFVYIDGAEDLSSGRFVMYWLYTATFGVIVFFILLNFFLAIIVDAFGQVKDGHSKHVIMGNILLDTWRVFRISSMWHWKGWPSRDLFMIQLSNAIEARKESLTFVGKLEREFSTETTKEELEVTISPEVLLRNIEGLTEEQLAEILLYYFSLSQKVLVQKVHGGDAVAASPGQESARSAERSEALSPLASIQGLPKEQLAEVLAYASAQLLHHMAEGGGHIATADSKLGEMDRQA